MQIRRLERDEIETIWRIERSEVHHAIYQLRDGALVLTPAYFDIQGWPAGQIAHETPALYTCFERLPCGPYVIGLRIASGEATGLAAPTPTTI